MIRLDALEAHVQMLVETRVPLAEISAAIARGMRSGLERRPPIVKWIDGGRIVDIDDYAAAMTTQPTGETK
jgi:hypothetical protein